MLNKTSKLQTSAFYNLHKTFKKHCRPWAGQFMLTCPAQKRARKAMWKAVEAVCAHRPTRVVIQLGSLGIPGSHAALQQAEWVGEIGGELVMLFQNELAEAVSPCRSRLRAITRQGEQRWNVRGRAWPSRRLPPGASAAITAHQRSPSPDGEHSSIDASGGLALAPFLGRHARRAVSALGYSRGLWTHSR